MMFYNIEMRNWITLGACGFVFLNFMTAAETLWIRIASSNFDMYTTAGERSARATLQYFEQVRSFFAQTMPHPLEESVRVRIVAFNSLKEYEPYRLNEFEVRERYVPIQSSAARDTP